MQSENREAFIRQVELSVSEIFGPTLQGEGASQGKPTMFLRLSLCNLDCSWCDTPYTWDWQGKNGTQYVKAEQIKRMSVADVLTHMPPNCDRIVITGGEPMLQQKALLIFIEQLALMTSRHPYKAQYKVEIETNGTLMPSPDFAMYAVQFNVSPKLSNSGVPTNKAINFGALTEYKHMNANFKFVVKDNDCLREITTITKEVGIPNDKVWLMPEGRTAADILQQLPWAFDVCAGKGFNLSPRLHVLAHNDKRGI